MSESLPTEVVIKLPKWKREYGDVFLWKIGDIDVVYRGCTFNELEEYNELQKHNVNEAEDFVVKTGVLHPRDLDLEGLPVSVSATLAKNILEGGQLHEEKTFFDKLEDARRHANSYHGLGTALIAHAFNMDPAKVGDFTLSKFTKYFAMAEVALQRRFEPSDKKKTSRKNQEREGINFASDIRSFNNMGYGRENPLGV